MSYRVLVADSSQKVRADVLRAISEMGIEHATEAVDGEQAIDQFRQGQFDLVLIRWDLETKNGQKVVDEIRSVNRDIPIIALTNETGWQNGMEQKSGVVDSLVTPFTTAYFQKKLERFVPATAK